MDFPQETEAALSPSEIVRYEAAWQQYRVYSARYWLVFLGYVPAVFFFGWLLSFAVNDNLAHGIVAFGWMALWMIAGQGYVQFRMPALRQQVLREEGLQQHLLREVPPLRAAQVCL